VFVEAIEGLSAATTIYDQRKTIAAALRRFATLALKGSVRVAVFGEGGSGKSTLGSFVTGELDTDVGAKTYNETLAVENFGLAGSIPGKLIVPPGQSDRRPGNWDSLYALLSSGKASRVINIASWGYLSTELERPRVFPGEALDNDDAFRERYILDARDRELRALSELVPHLRSAKGSIHMITFVNKQDLWWHSRYEAMEYFQNGPYRDRLEEVFSYKGSSAFQHDIVSAALVQQNLRTADGFEIAATAAGYDDALRVANLGRAASAFNQMIAK
jgi:hypothetical protein